MEVDVVQPTERSRVLILLPYRLFQDIVSDRVSGRGQVVARQRNMAYFRDGLQDVDAHTRRGTQPGAGRDLGSQKQVRSEMPVHVLEGRENNPQLRGIHRSLTNIVPRLGDLQVRGNDLDLAVRS